MNHKPRMIKSGQVYTVAVWEYRGVTMSGHKPKHNWRGSNWNWRADKLGLSATTKNELMNKIDKRLGGEW